MAIAIKGYRILKKIGEGGMAEIYKAHQISLDRVVAIKVLKPIDARDPKTVAQFKSEANAVAHLKHNNIVQVYEAGEQEGLHYFIMEYVGGESVANRIERKGLISEDQALLIAESIAVAMEYAWKKSGLIHCDIKPSNVLIDNDGTIKLSDFSGLTRDGVNIGSEDVTDVLLGTPQYMAPEHVRGIDNLDNRSDMYGLGALLYHMLTGQMPFGDKSGEEALECQLSDFIDNPRDINSAVSLATAQLIEKLMAKNRDQRFENWSECLSAVHKAERRQLPELGIPRGLVSTVRHAGPYADELSAAAAKAAAPAPAPAALNIGDDVKNAVAAFVPLIVKLAVVLAVVGGIWWMIKNYSPEAEPGTVPHQAGRVFSNIRQALNLPEPGEPLETAQPAERDQSVDAEPQAADPEPQPAVREGRDDDDYRLAERDEPQQDDPSRQAPQRNPDRFNEYISLMSPAMEHARRFDFNTARDALRNWQMENIGHPSWARIDKEKERLNDAQGVLQSLEDHFEELAGLTLENVGPSRISGDVVSVLNGEITLRSTLGAGQVNAGVEMADMSGPEIANLLQRVDEENFESNMARLLIARGQFKEASDFINRASEKGSDVTDLVQWNEDWQFLNMNTRALAALNSIEAQLQNNRPADAGRRLQRARQYFADTDIFSWSRQDQIAALEQRIAAASRRADNRAAAEEIDDPMEEKIAELKQVRRVSLADIIESMAAYDGELLRISLSHRSRINPSPQSTYTTELIDGDRRVKATFDRRGYAWVRNIPLFNTGDRSYEVFAEVDAGEASLHIEGLIDAEDDDQPRTW